MSNNCYGGDGRHRLGIAEGYAQLLRRWPCSEAALGTREREELFVVKTHIVLYSPLLTCRIPFLYRQLVGLPTNVSSKLLSAVRESYEADH
jgi:hypothetical protein